mmetsp:Transcript_4260/g.12833  ORF Transcript_4260/g.12833 Transcript_4260/m.12833 type:complete len:675 (-) Transcript_4260:184-2208(-)
MGAGLIAIVFSDAPLALREYVRHTLESEGVVVDMEAAPDEAGRVVAELDAEMGVLLSQAERIALGKKMTNGDVKPFRVAEKEQFVNGLSETLFSESERIMLLWQIIHNIQPEESDFEDIAEHETLLDWLQRNGHVEDCFALHNPRTVSAFLKDISIKEPWLSDDLIDRMRDYFGDRVALYFAFMATYTSCLLSYAACGIIVSVMSFIKPIRPLILLIFAVFASCWSTWMLQRWYQKNIKLVYSWRGVVPGDEIDETLFERRLVEDIRPEFIGEMRKDEVTGENRPTASKEDTGRRALISNTLMTLFFLSTAQTIFRCFQFEDGIFAWLADEDDEYVFLKVFPLTLVLQNVPLVVFITTMMVLDKIFGKIASKLTDFENHQLKRQHSLSLTRKLTGFQFLNTFGVFLYIAFIRKNSAVLQARVRNLFIVELVIGNIKETIIPIVKRSYDKMQKQNKLLKEKSAEVAEKDQRQLAATSNGDQKFSEKVKKFSSKPFLSQLWRHSKQEMMAADAADEDEMNINVREQLLLEDPGENNDDDYYEMYRQLGIITLFAVAWPLGAVLAAINNCIEIYTDFLKMVRNTKRPIPSRETSIGAWFDAMQTLSLLSFMTNLLLFFHTLSDGRLLFGLKTADLYVLMIFLEHFLLTVRSAYVSRAGSIPDSVKIARTRKAYNVTV